MNVAAPVKPVDPKKTALTREYKHNRPLTACHWEPQSRYVFFGAEDNLVHRFDLSSGKVVSLAAHDSWVRSFGSSLDGELLYSGGYDGRLIFWPTAGEQPKPVRVIEAHQGWLRAISVSPNGKHIATCGNDLLIKLWDAANGALIKEFSGHKSHIYNLTFSRDSSSLTSCDLKGVVNFWTLDTILKAKIVTPRELITVKALHTYDTTFRADIGGARGIALSSDGGQLGLSGIIKVTNAFAGVGEIAVAVVNLKDGKLVRILESKDKTQGTAWGVAHHPDGFWIALTGGRGGGWLFFWRGDAQHEFFKLKLKDAGRGMSISRDYTQVAVAHSDKHLRTYNLHGK